MKKLLYSILILGGIFGVMRLSHTLTDGFALASITSTLPHNPAWEVTIEEEDVEIFRRAISQPYRYLDSGSQSYVFISEDGHYILKFFNHKRWRLNPLLSRIPLPASLDAKRERWKAKKLETVNSTFSSCIVSYEQFKEETALFYLHLNPTSHLNRSLIVRDRIGIKHHIALDSIPFLLQKRAITTDTYLLSLKNPDQLEKAKRAITALLNFTLMRAQKGYSDKDPHLIRNFGFIDDQVVEIDVGGFHRDPKKDLNYFYKREIFRIQKKLLPWLNTHYPELSPHAEAQIQEILENRKLLITNDINSNMFIELKGSIL